MGGIPGMSQQDLANINARLTRVESVTPYATGAGNFAASQWRVIRREGMTEDGRIDLGSSGSLKFSGILSPNIIDGVFSFACASDSTVTIYWDGTNSSRVFLIRNPDLQGVGLTGASVTVPPNNMTVTGLTPSATYTAFAYWSPSNKCGLGFSSGNSGTPAIAFNAATTATVLKQAQASQSIVGREPIGTFTWTQPTPGGTSAGSPPSDPTPVDPGTCVMVNTNIEPLGEIAPHEWRTQNFHQREWVRLETSTGRVLACTPNHPLYSPDGQQRADRFSSGKWIITDQGEEKLSDVQKFLRDCTKVQVEMSRGHLFWANGFLSHNIKIPQQ